MTADAPRVDLSEISGQRAYLDFAGSWTLEQGTPRFEALAAQLQVEQPQQLECRCTELGDWDSALMAYLLQCFNYCAIQGIELCSDALPEGARRLLAVSTAVKTHQPPPQSRPGLAQRLNPAKLLERVESSLLESLGFIGEVSIAFLRWLGGRANTRRSDFFSFIYQAGPDAFWIITLTSFLVGMILAYLGAAQLAQFGAQIYVADLVVIGMLREMGVLMTAVVMAGRTGAAYAAQLGTMKVNEEIDALTTLGINEIDFLVLPRFFALIIVMPFLTMYASILGIIGGVVVAMSMLDVSMLQYVVQTNSAIGMSTLLGGLFKSVIYGAMVALTGTQQGIACGSSAMAVGQSTTRAVVMGIVLIVVSAAILTVIYINLDI
jgi:phospholipid/cholesterol/gamma-HCH transport system permease protein